jgi:hypothetical protein
MPPMPKAKSSSRAKPTKAKQSKAKSPARRAPLVRAHVPKPPKAQSEEYVDYLERYAVYGAGRPRLSSAEFDRLDDEMLDLLALESEGGLNDEHIVRLQELEFLLLDSEQ